MYLMFLLNPYSVSIARANDVGGKTKMLCIEVD